MIQFFNLSRENSKNILLGVLVFIVVLIVWKLYSYFINKKYYNRMYHTEQPIFHVHDLIHQDTQQTQNNGDRQDPQPNAPLFEERTLKQRGVHEFIDVQNGITAFEYFRRSVEIDHDPESVIYIAQLYSNGVHNSVNPDKVVAARMYQVILNNAQKFPQHIVTTARQRYAELNLMNPGDIQPGVPLLPEDYPFELERNLVFFRDYPQTQQERRRLQHEEQEQRQNHFLQGPLRQHVIMTVGFGMNNNDVDLHDEQYINDVIRNLENEDQIRQIARVQVINNDAQNVHSSVVLNSAQKVLESIESKNSMNFNECKQCVIDACTKCNVDVQKIQRVLKSFNNQPHARFQKSDTEIFITMVQKIQKESDITKRENLMEILCRQLESCIEKDAVVCNTGRIVRILSVYDGVDDSVQQIIPEFVIDQELANLATRVRDSILQNATEEQRNSYDTGGEGSHELTELMKSTFRKEVVNTYAKLIPSHTLQNKIDVYSQGF
jgi:hypothetical protein